MSRTCALCVDEEAEGSKRESTAAVASAAFKDVAAKIFSLKVSDSVNRLKIAMAQELHSTSIASPQSVPSITNGSGGNNNNTIRPHPLERQHSMLNTTSGRQRLLDIQLTSNDSLDSSGRDEDEDEESITPSFLESSSSSSDSGSSIASAQSSSDDPEVLSDVLDSESLVHSIQSNQKTSNNAQPKLKSSASRRYSASAASDEKPSTPRRFSDRPSTANSISGSSTGKSASKRPPPPPPPPRTIKIAANNSSDTKCKKVRNDISMAVLNPHPEPELQGEFPFIEITTQQQHPEVMRMPQDPFPRPEGTMDVQQQPEWQHQEAPVVGKSKDWMKYATKASRRDTEDSNSNGRKSKIFSRKSSKKVAMNEQIKSCTVRQMPFTDQFGDFGFYTGQVDDEGRPDGKGIMKYENGVFYEGTWMDGCQDKHTASRYERIQSGFTSWGGKGQGATKSGSTLPWNSRKMMYTMTERRPSFVEDWTDFNGPTGRYTGGVNKDQLPHGTGIMKYDFGLIAQGDWVNGILNEGPHDRMISAAASMGASMTPGGSVGPGMSVGPGAFGYAGGAVSVLGAGGMAVAPPLGFGGGSVAPGMSIGPGMSVGPMSF